MRYDELPVHSVLICEDDPAVRTLLTRIFEGRDFRVDVARDGRVALQKLSAREYAVMLLDLTMPELNGYEVVAALRGITRRPLVIVLTADSRASAADLDAEVVQAIVKKPFDLDLLMLVVEGIASITADTRLRLFRGAEENDGNEAVC